MNLSEGIEDLRRLLFRDELRSTQHLYKQFCCKSSKEMGQVGMNSAQKTLNVGQTQTEGDQLTTVLHKLSIGIVLAESPTHFP
jgi:hypothetical protein